MNNNSLQDVPGMGLPILFLIVTAGMEYEPRFPGEGTKTAEEGQGVNTRVEPCLYCF